jgi:hypothetical protein
MVHTDTGFWLIVVVLVLIGMMSVVGAVFGGRLRAAMSSGSGGAEDGLAGLPFDRD